MGFFDLWHAALIMRHNLKCKGIFRPTCSPRRKLHSRAMETTSPPMNTKIGNEKLIRVLDAASAKLRSLLERQGRANGALRAGRDRRRLLRSAVQDGPGRRPGESGHHRDFNQVQVVIDPKSALFVSGSELDFSEDLQKRRLQGVGPNAVAHCSCGESFSA